jgi:predicted transposase YbfD/YdcC
MSSSPKPPLLDHFADLEDPRIDRTRDHPLINVLFIAICAVISGGEGWTDMETFGESKRAWLAQFLDLTNGTPSDDTFRRVISRLDPDAFEDRFRRWTTAVERRIDQESADRRSASPRAIALDGKTLRGSADRDKSTLAQEGASRAPLHLVSAWASDKRLVLAQETVDEKTNEISALPEVIGALSLKGSLVTIDAIGTQKDIARQIQTKGGDYVLALKSNHPRLYGDVKAFFEDAVDRELPGMDPDRTREVDGGHGRVEVRQCWATGDAQWLDDRDQWPGLESLAMVEAQRSEATWQEETEEWTWKETTERRYYISSLPPTARQIAEAVRTHWGIENQMHWVLDVSFEEDSSRIRKENGPVNVGLLRRIAMNALRQMSDQKSLKARRKKAGWNEDYLEQVLEIR